METSSVKQTSDSASMAGQNTPQAQTTTTRRGKKSGPSSHWTLMILFFSLLLDLLGFTVILPLIPSLLEYYGHRDQVHTEQRSALAKI